ncbi:MAG: hypothetical protein ACHRXM_34480 [Isosphaerales bacterium]
MAGSSRSARAWKSTASSTRLATSGKITFPSTSSRHDIERRAPGATGAAQRSPYSLTQEFLNRSPRHRWGFVSNGLRLILLRDNVSLVRAANVEFDLEAMFEGEVYSDFFLLFLLCHQSRVEILTEDRPEECWLERWSKLAEEQGTRAQEKLRVGVERAIQALGTGFRTTRGNTALNEALRSGELSAQEFYRELLRMVYRLLLLLVAEDKRIGDDQNMLHPPDSSPAARLRYARYYSVNRLRTLANQRRGTAHTDLYESLNVLFGKLRTGYAPLVRAITIIDNGLIKIIDGNFRSRSKYRWPLLSSAGCDSGSLAFVSA